MNMLSDEMLFYGGLVIVGLTLVMSIIFGIAFSVSNVRLKKQFNKEYGEKSGKRK